MSSDCNIKASFDSLRRSFTHGDDTYRPVLIFEGGEVIKLCCIEPVYLALRGPVVGGFMGWTIWGERWIGLLGGRGGWNPDDPAVFGLQSLKFDYIP